MEIGSTNKWKGNFEQRNIYRFAAVWRNLPKKIDNFGAQWREGIVLAQSGAIHLKKMVVLEHNDAKVSFWRSLVQFT